MHKYLITINVERRKIARKVVLAASFLDAQAQGLEACRAKGGRSFDTREIA